MEALFVNIFTQLMVWLTIGVLVLRLIHDAFDE